MRIIALALIVGLVLVTVWLGSAVVRLENYREANLVGMCSHYNIVDPIQRIHECPLGLAAHRHRLCPLHKGLDDAMALVEAQFRGTTIAAMMDTPTEDEDSPLIPLGAGGEPTDRPARTRRT